MGSLELTDQQSAAVAVAPRVSLDNIKDKIERTLYFTAGEAEAALFQMASGNNPLDVLTICLVVMKNGFTVIGKAAPASPENFNAELGRKFAYEDAIRQLWPLEGYALREALAARVEF